MTRRRYWWLRLVRRWHPQPARLELLQYGARPHVLADGPCTVLVSPDGRQLEATSDISLTVHGAGTVDTWRISTAGLVADGPVNP